MRERERERDATSRIYRVHVSQGAGFGTSYNPGASRCNRQRARMPAGWNRWARYIFSPPTPSARLLRDRDRCGGGIDFACLEFSREWKRLFIVFEARIIRRSIWKIVRTAITIFSNNFSIEYSSPLEMKNLFFTMNHIKEVTLRKRS